MHVGISALRNPNSVSKIQVVTCTTSSLKSERYTKFFKLFCGKSFIYTVSSTFQHLLFSTFKSCWMLRRVDY